MTKKKGQPTITELFRRKLEMGKRMNMQSNSIRPMFPSYLPQKGILFQSLGKNGQLVYIVPVNPCLIVPATSAIYMHRRTQKTRN
jgi:hypothetical protein